MGEAAVGADCRAVPDEALPVEGAASADSRGAVADEQEGFVLAEGDTAVVPAAGAGCPVSEEREPVGLETSGNPSRRSLRQKGKRMGGLPIFSGAIHRWFSRRFSWKRNYDVSSVVLRRAKSKHWFVDASSYWLVFNEFLDTKYEYYRR